jgi:hypothetical protein
LTAFLKFLKIDLLDMVIYIPLNVLDGMKLCPLQASLLSLERIRMPNLMNGGGGGLLISGTLLWRKINSMQ